MSGQVIVVRSGPGTSEAERALSLALAMRERPATVTLALIQDAVLLAAAAGALPAQQRLREAIGAGLRCVYLADDFALRGFGPDQALEGCVPVDYDGLVDLLVADGSRVAGAF